MKKNLPADNATNKLEVTKAEMKRQEEKYADIIDLPRPITTKTPMSNHDRAAQFAPFAALTGYDKAIKKTTNINSHIQDRVIIDSDEIDPENMLFA